MAHYLILPSIVAARERSAAAYAPLRPEGAVTTMLWSVVPHPADGRAALTIPPTPVEAGIGMTQDSYDALLTTAEQAALIDALPPDWMPDGA